MITPRERRTHTSIATRDEAKLGLVSVRTRASHMTSSKFDFLKRNVSSFTKTTTELAFYLQNFIKRLRRNNRRKTGRDAESPATGQVRISVLSWSVLKLLHNNEISVNSN